MKMIVIENDCVGCPREMGCLGDSCPYMNVPHYYCDDCKDETDIYEHEDGQFCINCYKKRLEKVVYTE